MPHRQRQPCARLGHAGKVRRARPPGPDHVRPDDSGELDLHRQPGHSTRNVSRRWQPPPSSTFTASLKGKLVLSAGLGGMGGAQPLAVTMNEGVALIVEVDERRIRRRLETRYLDTWTADLDEAVRLARERPGTRRGAVHWPARQRGRFPPALVRRGVIPDIVTDQTSAHDPLSYVPSGLSAASKMRAVPIRQSTAGSARQQHGRTCSGHARSSSVAAPSSSTTATTCASRLQPGHRECL